MKLVTQGSIGFPDQNPVDTNPTYKHCLSVEATFKSGKAYCYRVSVCSKTCKVLGFYFDIFQDWKVLEKEYRSWKVPEICLNQAIKFSESAL